MAVALILESGIKVSTIVQKSLELFIRVHKPDVDPGELPDDDPGFTALVKRAMEMEDQSIEAEVKVDVNQMAMENREIYRAVADLPNNEPDAAEFRAWRAVTRFLILAVQADTEGDALSAFDEILQRERQETTDVA